MVTDVLERSMETDTYHERDQRAFHDYLMRDTETIRALIDASTAPFFVIKALSESQRLRELMDEFDPARGLWIVRNFDDTVNSLMISFPGFAQRIQRIAVDRNSCGWRGENMSDRTHQIIRRHTSSEISEATAAALKWYYRNILFFEQEFHKDARVRVVFYEKLVSHPEPEMRAIFNFLGLSFDPSVTRWISPRSINRRPAPEIDPDVRVLCQQLHERFEQLEEP